MSLEGDRRVIFVFGSNLAGLHGAGSARVAHDKWGAKWGVGSGLTGNAYAIPTKHNPHSRMRLDEIQPYVRTFITYAGTRTDCYFRCVAVGCGYAGYQPKDMAPMFRAALEVPNIQLPFEFKFWLERNPEK